MRRILLITLGVALLVVAAAWLVMRNLGNPFLKGKIIAAAVKQGIALDFDEGHASLGSFHLSGLRIAQPHPDESAPPLVAIDSIDAEFSPWRAAMGGRFHLETCAIHGVHALIFADADGSTSVTRLVAQMPKSEPKKKKPEPLSKTLADLSNLNVSIGSLTIDGVSAELIEREGPRELGRTKFDGLTMFVSDVKGALDVRLATPEAGARVRVSKPGVATAAAPAPARTEQQLLADMKMELAWSARGKPPRGELSAELLLREQDLMTFLPGAPVIKQVLAFHASVLPQPAQHQTTVKVDQLRLLDGTATGALDADLADDGAGGVKPAIRTASFELILEPLRFFVPAIYGDLPALSGSVKLSATGVDLTQGLRIAKDGSAEADATLAKLSWKRGAQSAQVSGAKIELRAKPAGEGIALELKAPLESVKALAAGQTIELAHANLIGKATVTEAVHATGQFTLALGTMRVSGPRSIDAQQAEVRLSLKDANLLAPAPLHIAGGVAMELDFGRLLAKASGMSVDAQALKLRAPLQLGPGGAGSGEMHLEAAQLAVERAGHVMLAPTPVSAELHLARFGYDAELPARSTADAKLELRLGPTSAQLHVNKGARDLDYELGAQTATLAQAIPFVPSKPGAAQIPWQQIGVTFASKGSVQNLLAGPGARIAEETTLQVTHAALHGADVEVAADAMSATLSSKGTALRHEGDMTLKLASVSLQGKPRPGEENVKLHFAVDRELPKLDLHFEAAGEALPEGKLSLALAYEKAAARVTYAIDGELHGLSLMPEVLPPASLQNVDVDWSTLAFAVSGKGTLDGVVTSMRDLKPVMSIDPLKTIRGAQTLDLSLTGLDYSNDEDRGLELSSANVHLDAKETDAGKTLAMTATSPLGQVDSGGVQANFSNLSGALNVALGRDTLKAQLHFAVAKMTQDSQPAYPIGDAVFDAHASAGPDGTLHIDGLKFDNAAAGSTMTATGVVEAALQFIDGTPHARSFASSGPASLEQRGLRLTGELLQKLELLPAGVGVSGRGAVRIPFSAESNDFRYFHLSTGMEFRDADLNFTGRKLALTGLNAKIPVKLGLRLDDAGTVLLGGAQLGVYSRERFADYQPFLADEDFMTCETLTVGDSTVGPIAGNLRVDRNLIALDQLEMSAFGGKITGQLILDVDMASRTLTDVQFRGNVTGLAPKRDTNQRSDEVVDANAALRLNPRRLQLDGRIDIVTLGKDDLSAMLDAWDPYHSDPSANRTRKALSVGYPKTVRIGFHEGFTEIKLEMGGVAGAAGIQPMHLSTGPLLEKYVEPYLKLMKPTPKPKAAP